MQRLPAIVFTAATLVVLAFAAQASPPAAKADRVQVSPASTDAEVGQTLRFSAVGVDADGKPVDGKPTAWFAAPFDVGAADETGLVTVFAPGELRVGAIVNGKTGWATVRIKPQQVARVDIAPLSAPLVTGASIRLEARTFTATNIPRHDVPLTWRSESPKVATVDAAGVVTGLTPGRVVIDATSEQGSGTTTLTVIENAIAHVTVEPRTTTARTGDVVHFSGERRAGADPERPVVSWGRRGDDRSRRNVRRRASGHLHRHGHRRQPRRPQPALS